MFLRGSSVPRNSRWPGFAGPADRNPARSHREARCDLRFRVLGDGDHQIGSRRVRVDQGREVAPHLGARALRMRQEVEIVDRAHPQARSGRHQEGRRRVHEIEGQGSQGLDRRPTHAVPCPGQGTDGDPAVDEPGASQLAERRWGRPVAPGRTPERQLDLRSGRVALLLQGQQVEGELMHPLAHTGAIAQGRPVVEKQRHHGALYPTAKGRMFPRGGTRGAALCPQVLDCQWLDSDLAV